MQSLSFKYRKQETCSVIVERSIKLCSSGQLLLAKGEVDQAFAAFKIVLDGDRENVSALLGQVLKSEYVCVVQISI